MQVFFSLFIFLSSSTALAACYSDIESCAVYPCLAEELRCSPKNYLLRFGERYCQQFLKPEVRKAFSAKGRKTVDQIRLCLQEELVNDSRLICRNSKALAQEHHFDCYLSSGFCELSLRDKGRIVRQIYKELKDAAFARTSRKIAIACGKRIR